MARDTLFSSTSEVMFFCHGTRQFPLHWYLTEEYCFLLNLRLGGEAKQCLLAERDSSLCLQDVVPFGGSQVLLTAAKWRVIAENFSVVTIFLIYCIW